MIKKESLRIGNLVQTQRHKIIEVVSIQMDGINTDDGDIYPKYFYEDIEGIPLSEDWLNKCGFTFEFIKAKESNLPGTIYLAYNGLRLSLGFYRWIPAEHYLQLDSPFGSTKIRFVHELMNWFHGCTRQELQIKP